MIFVKNLSKDFAGRPVVQNVTFEAKKGQVLAFLGPNGAGKTTTMRIITGYLAGTTGSVQVAGYDIFRHPIEAKSRIGYLPEVPPLYPELTVLENLIFAAGLKGVERKQRIRKSKESAEQGGASDLLGRLAGHLSKGQKQRVGLSQSLVHDPEVLVLDEPTAGLDPRQIIETRQLVRRLAKNRTVILSTHILAEASMTCDRVVIIHQGRIVAEDTQEGLINRVSGSHRIMLRVRGDAAKARAVLEKVPGVARISLGPKAKGESVTSDLSSFEVELGSKAKGPESLASAVVKARLGLVEMSSITNSLEEVFLNLTKQANLEKGEKKK